MDTPKEYWKELLKESPINRYLLPDHVYNNTNVQHEWIQRDLGGDLYEKISQYAKQHHKSVSTVFYLGWSILLHRYSNSNDVHFGISISQRSLPIDEIEKIVGLLINTIALRIPLTADIQIKDLLNTIQSQFIQSQENAFLSLPEIKRVAGLTGGDELFDTLMVIENYPTYHVASKDANGLYVTNFSNKEFTHYPLTIIIDLLGELMLKSPTILSNILNHLLINSLIII